MQKKIEKKKKKTPKKTIWQEMIKFSSEVNKTETNNQKRKQYYKEKMKRLSSLIKNSKIDKP